MAPITQLVLGLLPLTTNVPYTDSLVAPVPAEHYIRYVTFLATGTRTFTCDPLNLSSTYKLASFDYDLYDAEKDPKRAFNLGKHVLMPTRDAGDGNSVFYTANGTFTYWCALPRAYSNLCKLTGYILHQGRQDHHDGPRPPGDESARSGSGEGAQERGVRAQGRGWEVRPGNRGLRYKIWCRRREPPKRDGVYR